MYWSSGKKATHFVSISKYVSILFQYFIVIIAIQNVHTQSSHSTFVTFKTINFSLPLF